MRILVTGLSTRAIAESAVRSHSHAGGTPSCAVGRAGRTGNSGEQVLTLDYFGDRDQRMLIENHALLRDYHLPFSADSLLQASRDLDYEAVAYISNLENHPDIVEQLAWGRILLGNAPAVLRQVRDWGVLREFCRTAPISCPSTLLPGEEGQAEPGASWLYKPVSSGGGRGIRQWDLIRPLDEAHVLQRYVAGCPASAAFVADGRRSVVFGLTEQLIGREALGSRGFAWCGNILPLAILGGAAVLQIVQRMADELTARFGLRGVNGMDLVMAEGPPGSPRPFLVEINPRYTASMELMEHAYGLNVWSLHLAALEGQLPDFSLADHPAGPFLAKGIVFARRSVTIPETSGWLEQGRRDIPYPGERIEAGHPICTVFAAGETRDGCWDLLVAEAKAVQREVAEERGDSL